MTTKTRFIGFLFCFFAVSMTYVFLSSSKEEKTSPELPQMQSFSATPRFPNEIEIFGKKIELSRYDLHERYERELTNMCYTHNSTILTIKRANRLFPIICQILKEENMPEDLVYLACIESALDTRAVSPAKAAGIWQFMSETGKQYGLEVNAEVDERYNVEKATRAACKYLRNAYNIYNDWLTVCASYNAGQSGISKKLLAQNQSSALNLFMAEETSRYIFRIMAMKEILRDPYHYGFVLEKDQLYKPIKCREIKFSGSITNLTDFADKHGISYYHLKEFNPWLRDSKLTNKAGKTYSIKIPEKKDMYYDREFKVYNMNWVAR